ncbi:MAG: hypothetical protein NC094_11445 [Bacteroidales bacterium]|nr:hypothetical protein [Lachnoclostridium sp.]MCM1385181.1 hypothetical protein [Lachnoclostridium sp.]MCM1466022.1 hypothetical protein [Bacteroidales bacterium]
MQVKSKNISLYAGQDERVMRHRQEAASAKNQTNQKNSKSIMAAGLKDPGDRILMKKQQAQKKALKIVGDTFSADKKLDAQEDSVRAQAEADRQQMQELKGYLADLENTPTEEMDEEMKAAHQTALLEYQKQYDSLEAEVQALDKSLTSMQINRLKSSPMLKAEETAEDIMEAASEEILGMLMEEAKDHIDEEQEKREEQAEKIAEEKEKKEEQIEKSKEKNEELEEVTEAIGEVAADSEDVQKELNDILDKMKLLKEDLKGAKVDEKL